MVNYCCVEGCGRNNKQSKHLTYYSFPKERQRQVQWLKAAGREDLLDRDQNKLTYRVCSRHFTPSSIKNKHLCGDAVPALCLPKSEDNSKDEPEPICHKGIGCNSCGNKIVGFRYKCVTCKDYDLCQKCEVLETHAEHYVLRIPKPLKYKLATNLVKKWQKFFNMQHATPHSDSDSNSEPHNLCTDSSDDEPITKYMKNYDSGLDLSDDIKNVIRTEVNRVINCVKKKKIIENNCKKSSVGKKRSASDIKVSKKAKIAGDKETPSVPEVVFADVNEDFDMKEQNLEVKCENESEGQQTQRVVKLRIVNQSDTQT